MTCMPKLISRCATSVPIRPKPRMPATLPLSSTPVNFDRFHSPALSDAAACGTLRATASSSAVASSAALTMLELGALTTITPALVAASTSTLSRPTPARAIDVAHLEVGFKQCDRGGRQFLGHQNDGYRHGGAPRALESGAPV